MKIKPKLTSITIEGLSPDTWSAYCANAMWALNKSDDADPNAVGIELLSHLIRHVSDAHDTPLQQAMINAVVQTQEGHQTLVITDIPDAATEFIREKFAPLPKVDPFGAMLVQMLISAENGEFKLMRPKSKPAR